MYNEKYVNLMNKHRFFELFIFFLFSAPCLSAQNTDRADAITGKWLTGEKNGIVLIFKYKEKYYGKLVWIKDSLNKHGNPVKDTKNPDPEKREQNIKGLIFMFNFTYDPEEDKWKDGRVYDPESGNTYSGYLKLQSKNVMDLRGYMGISLIGRTDTWTRVE